MTVDLPSRASDSLLPPESPVQAANEELVIKEARRCHRQRLILTGVVVLASATALVIAALVVRSTSNPPAPSKQVARSPRGPVSAATGSVQPIAPGPLAVGPNGTLYVADEGRNEILASLPSGRSKLPSGRFRVVAGDGKAGFSGDGGPAVDAELDQPEGMAVGSDGTIYFADRGNNRIRAVLPNGTITTIAGNGQEPASLEVVSSDLPAVQQPIGQLTDVAIGPDGSVYFGDESDVVKVDSAGNLVIVDDGAELDAADQGVMFEQGCYPASLVFDASDNLYIGCSSPWVMLEQTTDGALHYLGTDRPHDAWAGLTAAPGGGVFATDGAAVITYGSGPAIFRGGYEFLRYKLPAGGSFWPQGVAASPTYLFLDADGDSGIGPPAIVTGGPPGSVTVLWAQSYKGWIHSMQQFFGSGS